VAITAGQRRCLPASAFASLKTRKYPVPTQAQARKAGISEAQRLRLHRNALSRVGQPQTSGTYSTVARKVKSRAGSKVAAVGGPRGTASRPGLKKSRRR
jgi:hypothetical protein